MIKKLLILFLALIFILPITLPITALAIDTKLVTDINKVCGMDGQNYASVDAAETAGVDVSYKFACKEQTSENNMYEEVSDVHFVGMLIEVGSTDIPTNLIIKDNKTQLDYIVSINSDTLLGQRKNQTTNLSDWIPGDQIRVIGKKNENTESVEATTLVNLSIIIRNNQGINGWITAINKETQEITYQWKNEKHIFKYNQDTRFVVGLKNLATIDDLKINDRIRGRLLIKTRETPLAKIVIVLRRGNDLFMKTRTFTPIVTLIRLDSVIVPTTIQVKMDKTPGLRANDVNNLIGIEGALITINITENTKLVRKYFGRTSLEEFSIGDKLRIVGRVNDDGTIDAKMIKNNSIWKTSTRGHAGIVTGVDVKNSYITVNWTPIKYLTQKKLKTKLIDKGGVVKIREINKEVLKEKLRERIQNIKAEKIGKFLRNVRHKRVKINHIKHDNIKIQDLIKRESVKKVKVDINNQTKIVVGTNTNADISDIQIGDKVRIRGIRHAKLPIITANTIMVVNSLPEIEENLDTNLNDINEIVSEIVTDDSDNAIVKNSTSNIEEEIIIEEDKNIK